MGLLARGWIYSYYWTAASFVYLILRNDVDGTALTDITNFDIDTERRERARGWGRGRKSSRREL